MSKIAIKGATTGTGIFTLESPATNTDRTLVLPDEAGTVLTSASSLPAANLTGDVSASQITTALNATGSAPIYAARAWVNFNGTGTVAIRAAGNVSSITDNGTGDYTVNFTNAMPDANYAGMLGGSLSSADNGTGRIGEGFYSTGTYTTSSCRIKCVWQGDGTTVEDKQIINFAIYR